jgi:glutamate dehydrogenase
MHDLTELATLSPLSVEDLSDIQRFLSETGVFTDKTILDQITWFVRDLGIDDYYFRTRPVEEIARQILALGASELVSRHGGDGVTIQLISEESTRATYIVEDTPQRVQEVEARIEGRYPTFRLESYRTRNLPNGNALRFFVVSRPVYPEGTVEAASEATSARPDGRPAFEVSATTDFLERSLPETVERYRDVWETLNGRMAPVIRITEKPDSSEQRIMLGIHRSPGRRILTPFTELFRTVSIPIKRRYIEPFQDGKYVLTFYVDRLTVADERTLSQELNAVAMLPRAPISDLFFHHGRSARETMYAIAAAAFAHQFVSELAEGYHLLRTAVAASPEARGVLDSLRTNLTKNTFSTARIATTVLANPVIMGSIYAHFTARCSGRDGAEEKRTVEETLEREVPYHRDRTILRFFLRFNEHVRRTNFFVDDKVALAIRLESGFLDGEDFPEEPYGIFFLVGREFTGFHVRFRDIARGGIRIVRSRTADAWSRNVDTIFQENYNLAATQQRKNKDIPEGGSKGIVLMNAEYGTDTAAAESAFRSYVDALLDLLVEHGEEVLFLGPDEGSAGLMDWAALHARKRNYPFWKGFTTGKSLALGGVPHDRYGMTTRSVHTYATRLLDALGLDETQITKVQTGGPDGDLGSNEILLSQDRTIAIVDGSGVAWDPDGLDREELARLARARRTVSEFDMTRLGPKAFFVGVDDRDVTLPDGRTVANGEQFRNSFHLSEYMQADLFVPCGGRPAAINITNWTALLNEDKTPRVRAIVEGANLFVTQEARLRLEEAGVYVFKDASTNKGGVTSSSLEVYAGLAMTDEEFSRLMTVEGGEEGEESPYRRAYVSAVIERIESNAAAEFGLMWDEHTRTGRPLTLISDDISARINRITDAVRASDYIADPQIRRTVVAEYTPAALLDLVGLEAILERVPAAYLDAIVASRIGSRFVYEEGLRATEVDFARYMDRLKS